jgi:hypothetical protein
MQVCAPNGYSAFMLSTATPNRWHRRDCTPTRREKIRVVLHDSDRSCVSSWWIEATRTASGVGTRRELPIILSGKAKDDCLPGMTLSFRATPPLRSPPSTRLGSVPDCPVAYNNRGTDPHALGGLKAAVADFDRGFELAPGYAEASKKTKSRGASHDRAEMK